MPVEPMIETPTSPGDRQAAAERGAHHIEIGEHDRQALGRPVSAAAAALKRMTRRAPVDDRRQQSARSRDAHASRIEGSYRRVRKLPKVKLPSDGSVDALAGQLEIEPILAMEGSGRRGRCRSGCWRFIQASWPEAMQAFRPEPVVA